MKLVFILLLSVIVSPAQTNTIWGFQNDLTQLPTSGNVIITPLAANNVANSGFLVSPSSVPIPLNNGVFVATNVYVGSYNAVFSSGLVVTFNVTTNTLGSNNIVNLIPPPAAVFPPPYYLLNGSSTLFITLTNGPGIKFTSLSTNVNNGFTNVVFQVSTN